MEKCRANFTCGDLHLDLTGHYKYLVWFHENLDMEFAINELAKSASRELSALYTKFVHAGGMSYDVFCKLLLWFFFMSWCLKFFVLLAPYVCFHSFS